MDGGTIFVLILSASFFAFIAYLSLQSRKRAARTVISPSGEQSNIDRHQDAA